MLLEDRVRRQIGEEGPQLPSAEYSERIEAELDAMSVKELLRRISDELAKLDRK